MPSKEKSEGSRPYRYAQKAWSRWTNSLFARWLTDQRILAGGLTLFVLFSLARILLSSMHVTIKFMSFAVLLSIIALLVWPYMEPLSNR